MAATDGDGDCDCDAEISGFELSLDNGEGDQGEAEVESLVSDQESGPPPKPSLPPGGGVGGNLKMYCSSSKNP
jgi:hypothetical protein